MKKVKCGNDKCAFMKHYYDDDAEDWLPRKHQTVEVKDDFDERRKAFCSWTCACYAGYMTLNKDQAKEKGALDVGGFWWLKDPSRGTDERFKELWEREQNGEQESAL